MLWSRLYLSIPFWTRRPRVPEGRMIQMNVPRRRAAIPWVRRWSLQNLPKFPLPDKPLVRHPMTQSQAGLRFRCRSGKTKESLLQYHPRKYHRAAPGPVMTRLVVAGANLPLPALPPGINHPLVILRRRLPGVQPRCIRKKPTPEWTKFSNRAHPF